MIPDYYETARKNEEVFRNILRDLRDNREKRPMGIYVPENLETEASLDEIFKKYSEGMRSGIFTITSFSRLEKAKATFWFQDIDQCMGGGAGLEYLVNDDNSVKYDQPLGILRS